MGENTGSSTSSRWTRRAWRERGVASPSSSCSDRVVQALDLHPIGAPTFHTFDAPAGSPEGGGTTALLLLTESHLAAHGFPEAGALSVDLYTCRPRKAPDWASLFVACLGPCEVHVRRLDRGQVPGAVAGEGTR